MQYSMDFMKVSNAPRLHPSLITYHLLPPTAINTYTTLTTDATLLGDKQDASLVVPTLLSLPMLPMLPKPSSRLIVANTDVLYFLHYHK